jgi:hypothetical protein
VPTRATNMRVNEDVVAHRGWIMPAEQQRHSGNMCVVWPPRVDALTDRTKRTDFGGSSATPATWVETPIAGWSSGTFARNEHGSHAREQGPVNAARHGRRSGPGKQKRRGGSEWWWRRELTDRAKHTDFGGSPATPATWVATPTAGWSSDTCAREKHCRHAREQRYVNAATHMR